MTLMNRFTGQPMSDKENLVQSIVDIIMTPLGSRVAVRDYGCLLHTLVDKPVNRQWVIDGFFYIAQALARWEPRYVLNRIRIDLTNLSQGIVVLAFDGLYKPTGKVMVLENVALDFGVAA